MTIARVATSFALALSCLVLTAGCDADTLFARSAAARSAPVARARVAEVAGGAVANPDPERKTPDAAAESLPAAAAVPAPAKPVAGGLASDFASSLIAVHPDDFIAPVPTVPLSLRNVAASVIRGNRSIAVASFAPEQAKADIMAAKAAYDPEAFASVMHNRTEAPQAMIISGMPANTREFRENVARTGVRQHIPTGGELRVYREWNQGQERDVGAITRGSGGAYVAEISQPLLNGFADRENRALIGISRLQADISDEEFRLAVTDAMVQAMEAYWMVVQTRENLRINRESLTMAETLFERERGRKDEGISTQLDVNRANEAVATRAYNVDLAQEQYSQAQENLKYHINDKSVPVGMDIHVDAVESLETPLVKADVERSIDAALANRPEMKNADLAVRTADIRRGFARHSILPSLNLIGSLRRNDRDSTTPTSGSTTLYTGTDWSVGMEFALPIGNMEARANVRKAELESGLRSEEKRNVRDVVITEVRTVAKNLELVVREIPLNSQAVESARKVLEGERARLELNQIGNRDLLQAQDLVSVTERNYIDSLTRYNVYIIRLFAAEGTLLEKMGIRLAGGSGWQ